MVLVRVPQAHQPRRVALHQRRPAALAVRQARHRLRAALPHGVAPLLPDARAARPAAHGREQRANDFEAALGRAGGAHLREAGDGRLRRDRGGVPRADGRQHALAAARVRAAVSQRRGHADAPRLRRRRFERGERRAHQPPGGLEEVAAAGGVAAHVRQHGGCPVELRRGRAFREHLHELRHEEALQALALLREDVHAALGVGHVHEHGEEQVRGAPRGILPAGAPEELHGALHRALLHRERRHLGSAGQVHQRRRRGAGLSRGRAHQVQKLGDERLSLGRELRDAVVCAGQALHDLGGLRARVRARRAEELDEFI